MEYEPLFEPGFHDIAIDDIRDIFVRKFENPSVREYLVNRLEIVLSMLQFIGIHFELWINGSFATQKPEPGDVDIAIFYDRAELQYLAQNRVEILNHLSTDTVQTRMRYGCDLYFIPMDSTYERSYWRGWFGFDKNENPKGVPRLLM